jgi:hypothetical protein
MGAKATFTVAGCKISLIAASEPKSHDFASGIRLLRIELEKAITKITMPVENGPCAV